MHANLKSDTINDVPFIVENAEQPIRLWYTYLHTETWELEMEAMGNGKRWLCVQGLYC